MNLTALIRPTACESCPFNEDGLGRELRDSLAPGRFDGIRAELDKGLPFPCHETTGGVSRKTKWRKSWRVCAGSLAYQRKNHCVPDVVQVVERIAAITEKRQARW